jgi:redox-sensing transcriptional repressor
MAGELCPSRVHAGESGEAAAGSAATGGRPTSPPSEPERASEMVSRHGACELVTPPVQSPAVTERARRRIPEATVARLPVYLRSLLEIAGDATTVSSERLAELAGVNAAKVRKDLSYLGSYGTRGVGYDVEYLLFQMSRELGLNQHWPVVIVGIGNLGHALANYGGFGASGFHVVALVDSDPDKVGQVVAGIEIQPMDDLPAIARAHEVAIGIIATPAHAAQDVAELLVEAGVTSILNFAPAVLTVPDGVSMRKVDLAVELQILSFHQQRRTGRPPVERVTPVAAAD